MTKASALGPSRRLAFARAASVLLPLGLLLAVVCSLCIGAYPMSVPRSLEVLLHLVWPFAWPPAPDFDLREITVVEIIRPPRIVVATFAGVALGLAGAALQGMMRNPLVGPDLVGVSSGAAFGGVLAMLLDFPPVGLIACAFCGGLVAMALTFALARLVDARSDSVSLVLAGFFVGAFFLACVGLIEFLEQDRKLPLVVYWLLGSFRGADPQKVWMIALPTLFCGAALMALRWRINLLSLGEFDAQSLGVDVEAFALEIIALVVADRRRASRGLRRRRLGWARRAAFRAHAGRPGSSPLLPASAFLGGLSARHRRSRREAVTRQEIPIGVLTSVVRHADLRFPVLEDPIARGDQ